MPNPQRPVFAEGLVLAAADLTAIVDHARLRAARHDRYLHEWGIAEGLSLTTEPASDDGTPFTEVTLQPGLAVDGTGREVVVPAPVTLQESLFQDVNGAEPAADDYPVFLAGLDRDPPATTLVPDACGAGRGPTRIEESYQILFGRVGDERLVAEQRPPAVGDSPGDGRVPWLVLLGYVRWRNGHFVDAVASARRVGPRYAGVRADTVAARGGRLTLRSQTAVTEGGPVLTLDGRAGLSFGRYTGDGSVEGLLTVSPRGDLTVRGSISGGQRGGGVLAVSGVATDGMLLPLPDGVTADHVAGGRAVLHVSVTPHLTDAPPSGDGVWLAGPLECTVDDDRRLRCRIRWYRVDPGTEEPRWRDEPGSANFVILATVAPDPDASGGSGQP